MLNSTADLALVSDSPVNCHEPVDFVKFHLTRSSCSLDQRQAMAAYTSLNLFPEKLAHSGFFRFRKKENFSGKGVQCSLDFEEQRLLGSVKYTRFV